MVPRENVLSSQPDFEDLYRQYYDRIHSFLKRMVGEHAADDVTQEVFVKVNKALPEFKGRSKLSTWIYRIATNAALDRMRSKAYKQECRSDSLTDPVDGSEKDIHDRDASGRQAPPVDESAIKTEMNDCIREFVDNLSPNYRAVIALSELNDLANREVADILGITLDNMKIRLHRARVALKEDFKEGCDFYSDDSGELSCDRKTAEPGTG